ncbi:DNA repair protein RadA [Candidatus Peregrinibacteria bacterium]|nr:DNA repair protein RadA [Candidatus Peregrinibacteria bacterium]
MKTKTIYTCSECGYQSPKWVGKCTTCEAWNSFSEHVQEKSKIKSRARVDAKQVEKLTVKKSNTSAQRIPLKMDEANRVLGGGILEGSITLLTGEPGIGKSTLTIQLCDQVASRGKKVLYVSGEESQNQIAGRADRLGINTDDLFFLAETNTETILESIKKEKPHFIIIDSVQVLFSHDIQSTAGSITQVRHATELFMEFAKTTNTPVVLIGHVTKDGNLAGPRVLEHLVDTVLYLEGDRFHQFRILRSQKNRFGSTNEVGIFEMHSQGLKEVKNPSAHFLEGRKKHAIGSAITVTLEGTRPILVEVQALANVTPFGYPKRTATGYDVNRMQLLISVLQKYAKMNLSNQDVFVNVVGGMKISDPSCDLGVLMAIASSFSQKTIPTDTCYIGEVGLSGEIRSVPQLDKRVKEAKKLGFKNVITPKQVKDIFSAVKTL